MTRKLFHITNSSVIFGCLVGLVYYHQCHRPTWSLGLSCLSSTKFTVILGCLVYLVCYHQCHRHTWSLGLSCLSSTKFILVAWFIFQDYSATNGQSKTHQNFSSKRKLPYHKIGRSARLSPPPFSLFKACTFYPCVPYFIFLSPLLNPLFLTPLPEV